MDRIRMSSYEREAIMKLAIADQCITDARKNIEKRVKMLMGGLRDLRCAEVKLERLLRSIMDTIPLDQLRAYEHAMMDTSFTVGVRCRATSGSGALNDEYGTYVTYDALQAIVDGPCREMCHFCGKDTEGQKRCELRKALDTIPTEAPVRDDDSCPYYEVI